MTEQASTTLAEGASYLRIWQESFAQVLGQISARPVPCVIAEPSPAEVVPAADDLWIVAVASGNIRGEMSLHLAAPSVLRLAQIFMSEPEAPEAALTADHREAALELLRQVAGLAATGLKPEWGEIQLRLEATASPPSWPASSTTWLQIGPELALVEIHLSAALTAALRAEKVAADRVQASGPASAPSTPGSGPEEDQAKLDLLLDVELALTLRFGSRHLPLREVLDLSPGAVVELDRQVNDPVDLLLDGRLLARGEVVVLNGSYGLRVTEVAPAAPASAARGASAG